MNHADETPRPAQRSTLARLLKTALVLLGILIGGVAATAWLSGGQDDLPFEYEGFD
jgi:hypothetical protein